MPGNCFETLLQHPSKHDFFLGKGIDSEVFVDPTHDGLVIKNYYPALRIGNIREYHKIHRKYAHLGRQEFDGSGIGKLTRKFSRWFLEVLDLGEEFHEYQDAGMGAKRVCTRVKRIIGSDLQSDTPLTTKEQRDKSYAILNIIRQVFINKYGASPDLSLCLFEGNIKIIPQGDEILFFITDLAHSICGLLETKNSPRTGEFLENY